MQRYARDARQLKTRLNLGFHSPGGVDDGGTVLISCVFATDLQSAPSWV